EGPSALDRFYQTQDGWLRLQAPAIGVLQAAGLLDAGAANLTDENLTAAIADKLRTQCTDEAVARFSEAGVPAAAARVPLDLPNDPPLQALEMFTTQHMRDGTPFYVTNRYARFSRTQAHAEFTAPGIGQHSREVLAEAGIAAEDIDALVDAGAVTPGEPFTVVAIQNYR
ncbi:MAG: CoA transferase, partial [Chloroflexi bacterium]|nr:CoA transferase [Chloroflexota bacterium]